MNPSLLTLALLLAAPTTDARSALEVTKSVLEKTREIVASPRTHDDKLGALDALLRDFLDTEVMAREALGAHWTDFSRAQQREFLGLFRELFHRTYVQKLLLFERPDFAYDRQELDPDGARVETRILTPKDEFKVSYRMRMEAGRWRATDIQIEDLSLTANFKRQLDHLLRGASPEALLDRLRRKFAGHAEAGL